MQVEGSVDEGEGTWGQDGRQITSVGPAPER